MYWIIIPVVFILGSFFMQYQKLKMKQLRRGTHQDMEDLQTMVNSLKKRIEHLEAIVAEPEAKKTGGSLPEVKQEGPGARAGKMENMLNNE